MSRSSHVYVGGIASEYCVKETVPVSFAVTAVSVTLLIRGWAGSLKRMIKKAPRLKDLGVLLVEA